MNMEVARSAWNWDDIIADVDTALYQHDFGPKYSIRRRVGRHWVDFDPNHPQNVNIDPPQDNETKLSTLVEVFDIENHNMWKTVRVVVTLDKHASPIRFEVKG